jgi:hypothetical protein
MKRAIFCALALFLLVSVFTPAEGIDLSRIGLGARSIAMGRAQAAGRDLLSVFVNPANAAFVDKFSAASMYSAPMEDVSFSLIGLGFPIKEGLLGTFSISFINAGVGGILATSLDASGRAYQTSSFDFSNKTLILSYGKDVNADFFAGASLKLLSTGFDGQSGGNGSGADLDAGVIFYPRENLVFGLVLQNLLPASMGGISWGTGYKEKLPIGLRAGLSCSPMEDATILADYESLGAAHAGLEYLLKKNLAMRGGLEYLSGALNYSLGVGLKLGGFSFDYAYYINLEVPDDSAHYFSLGFELPQRTIEIRPFMPAQIPGTAVALD